MIQMCVVLFDDKVLFNVKKKNDTNVCCREDDKVLLDVTKK